MVRIWGRRNSINVMKVVWTAEELGLAYERVDVGGPFGQLDAPAFGAMNPNRKIPVLEEDGLIVWESNTIVRYLAASRGSEGLLPTNPARRALVEKWMDWVLTELNPPIGTIFIQLIRTPEDQRDLVAVQAACPVADQRWRLLDEVLARHPYVAGDSFTAADLAVGPFVHRWYHLPPPATRAEMPHVRDYYERLRERPAYLAHCCLPLT